MGRANCRPLLPAARGKGRGGRAAERCGITSRNHVVCGNLFFLDMAVHIFFRSGYIYAFLYASSCPYLALPLQQYGLYTYQ